MKSPFPGMDPFLEHQDWEDFHATFVSQLSETLMDDLGPEYLARIGRRTYFEYQRGDEAKVRRHESALVTRDDALTFGEFGGEFSIANGTAIHAICELHDVTEEHVETRLTIRDRESLEVVTVIELLSPANKRPQSDGRTQYLAKRGECLSSSSHLVELDLLRTGERMPMKSPWPHGDFCAVVSRADRRPKCEVYPWTLTDKMPSIPIPLKRGDADVRLALQSVFDTVWQRARYDRSLDYRRAIEPGLSDIQRRWISEATD